jgi:DNA-binding transcriptional regulator YbjK
MAKTIGSLNVSMGLSITDFIANLDKVKEDMSGLEAVTAEAAKHFDDDVSGVMGDALHKFGKTSKLGADDALAFAVSLKKLGLDADTITSTLDKFAKGIGKFANNAGEASKAFAGILGKIGGSDKVLLKDIQALESMGVKAFDSLAKELSKVEGKAITTADVMKRIASGAVSGKDALKLLTQGGRVQADGGDKGLEQKAKSKLASFLNHVESKIKSAASSIFSSVTNLIMNPVTAIGGALASYGVYKIYDRAVEAFANTEEILTRIKGLAGEASADKLGGVMNEIANQGRIAQDAVGKLATGFLGLGVSGADAARMIESFGRTSLVAGSGASDVFGKLGEVAQSMVRTGEASKGDFEALAAMGLPVYDALAQRLSKVQGRAISANEAMQMLASGKVGTADALNALAGMKDNGDVIKQAEAQAGTLKGIYARLAGEVEGFFTEFGSIIVEALDLKGFSNGLIGFMQNLRSNFDSLVPALKNIGMVIAVVRDVLFQAFSGLVNFFTTMGGADVAAGNIDNIRSVVIQFAKAVTSVLQSVMMTAVEIVNNLSTAMGGIEKFAAMIAGGLLGAGTGAVAGGLTTMGVGAPLGALVGGVTGAIYGASKVDATGNQIDPAAINAKITKMFDEINASIGSAGSDVAQSFVGAFVEKLTTTMKGKKWFAEALGNISEQFGKLETSLSRGEIKEGAFLSGLTTSTGSGIAIFKRQMDLGAISAESFEKVMGQLKGEAFLSLDNQLRKGTITNDEYGNTIMAIQAQFDALNPPDIAGFNASLGGDNTPAWIKELSNQESPLETYRKKLEELKMTMQDRPDLFAAGAAQLADELERSVGAMEELKNPGALMQGSSAAFSQALKIQNANGGESATDRLIRLQQRAEEKDTARNNYLAAIAAATSNQANMVVANIN